MLFPVGRGVPAPGLESATTKSGPGLPGLTSPTANPAAARVAVAVSSDMHWTLGTATKVWSGGHGPRNGSHGAHCSNVGSQGGGTTIGQSSVGAKGAPQVCPNGANEL